MVQECPRTTVDSVNWLRRADSCKSALSRALQLQVDGRHWGLPTWTRHLRHPLHCRRSRWCTWCQQQPSTRTASTMSVLLSISSSSFSPGCFQRTLKCFINFQGIRIPTCVDHLRCEQISEISKLERYGTTHYSPTLVNYRLLGSPTWLYQQYRGFSCTRNGFLFVCLLREPIRHWGELSASYHLGRYSRSRWSRCLTNSSHCPFCQTVFSLCWPILRWVEQHWRGWIDFRPLVNGVKEEPL